MTGKRNNKASGTSALKRPAQSPPSGGVQGQGSSSSDKVPTSQPSANNLAKCTRDTASTSPLPPADTNTSPSASDSGTSFEDSRHSPSNTVNKGKNIEILPLEPEHAASPDASTAAIQSSPLRFYVAAAPSTIEGFWEDPGKCLYM
ncbi:unnamed protein product [Rhizophagus irregularis]|nr:unnamed protein product [Rhizophagus irregularis]